VLPGFVRDRLNLNDEQKKKLDKLQKEVDAKLAEILTPEQAKALKEMPTAFGGRGGFGGSPGGPPGGFPGGPGFRGPGGGLDEVKKQLGASDEDWKVIKPKLDKVLAARRVLNAEPRGASFGFGGPGGTGPMGSNALTQAQTELKAVLDDPKHTPEEVREKVAAVRKARQQARGAVEAAQRDLLLLLTAEQEAVLLSQGYLD
jgi:Spy/CpxP family protein refolding chaperone